MFGLLPPPDTFTKKDLAGIGAGKCLAEVAEAKPFIRVRVIADLNQIPVANPGEQISPSRVVASVMEHRQRQGDRVGVEQGRR